MYSGTFLCFRGQRQIQFRALGMLTQRYYYFMRATGGLRQDEIQMVRFQNNFLPNAKPYVATERSTRFRLRSRLYSSSSSGEMEPKKEEALRFIQARGFSREVGEGIIKALLAPSSGISLSSLVVTVKALAGAYEREETSPLLTMAKAVEQELARTSGKNLIKFVVYTPREGESFECEGFEGMSLKEVVDYGEEKNNQVLGEYIECACSGIMACSTCHVYVDPAWWKKVGSPSKEELDMIDLAYEPTEYSRLGCQIRLSKDLEGLKISIPDGANNLFDHIPFE
mmetsp:Transcript_5730/g.7237  ORF Transcript_5730/g.7237 Transcript_5730/m.7237 type:complete len:283 (+) Transcript_5730:59-907(+)|eukprot:CAMPEP_0204834180 /NCGR_PEP_ID=MMETSP1346-20131115/19039_1 /ASSEMBLY_ACC=CAM_ASM_000771 /TAXON_ID=215587 /ORGANISM="Aplanochytrium stocchinoi, Strain GSBS06" /LENGTH=282 /DNA_ID=CAMNT_0051967293 /DNA_START=344 /DNA_END=1192 /DNA_ORIENTATION=-